MAMRGRNAMGGRNPGRRKAIEDALRQAMGGGRSSSPRPRLRPQGMSASSLLGEAGKTISDADRQRAMDRASMLESLEFGETGKGMSDADMARLKQLLGSVASGGAGAAGRAAMTAGRAATGFKKGGAVRKKKPKNGCVMKGRGGSYKGQK